MKYSSYVEPAKHMLEQSPIWYQIKYAADPISLPNGQIKAFGQYPLMEWGIVLTSTLLPFNSIEYNARIYMTILGITILLMLYKLLIKIFSKLQTILILFLLSINNIFQFFTYVTVLDPITIIFILLSFFLLLRGTNNNSAKDFFLSGILAGISINTKYHIAFFYTPLFLIYLYSNRDINEPRRISLLLLSLPNFILQTILFRIGFAHIPEQIYLSISYSVIITILQIYIYKNVENISKFIENIMHNRVKIFYLIMLIVAIISGYLLLHIQWIRYLFDNFITDRYLIFNFEMYSTFINRYSRWITEPIFYYSLLMIIFGSFIYDKKKRLLMYSMLVSTIIYIVSISKVIYFHEYYNHVVIITLLIFFSSILLLKRLFTNILSKIALYILIAITIFMATAKNIDQTNAILSYNNPTLIEVANYIKNRISSNQYFIYSSDVHTAIGYYADRMSLFENLNTDYNTELVKKIKNKISNGESFSDIMHEYNIHLYINMSPPGDRNNDFTYLFQKDIALTTGPSERTLLIICKENKQCKNDNRFLSGNSYALFDKYIRPHLNLEKQIGKYYIYSFR